MQSDLREDEVHHKLELIRRELDRSGLGAVRLRGVDWFAWATGGASNAVSLSSETGIAELLVSSEGAWVLTSEIEAARLGAEELPHLTQIRSGRWDDPSVFDNLASELSSSGPTASDRPRGSERPLPPSLVRAKRRLLASEVERYRRVGSDTAEAVTDVLLAARPDWSENRLAGAAAAALWRRGIHPTLTLVAGERRLPIYRHPTPTAELLGARAMLVVCGRRSGLYANMTRFVSFREPLTSERESLLDLAAVEAAAWRASRPGQTVGAVYQAIVHAYAEIGLAGAEREHHQGGTTGYLSREVIATPDDPTPIDPNSALAWNPSVSGAKIEDTVITTESGLEVLTIDARWPTFIHAGRTRPDILVQN